MACCAIAFFLISQILWPLRWIAVRIPVAVRNNAVSWSPSDTAPCPSHAFASTGALVLAATLMLGSIAQAGAHDPICSTHDARGN
ncbi:MAG: hypothetical protein HOP13_04805 [Alphaproteobacteria bacterium]|nr:hypothetical protein [Alphaproteobacteria bacterium]